MDTRESLLEVTARLYAEHGWLGTTTRRIAEAAGVNEVTLFRQFGSKESLLLEAIQQASCDDGHCRLPEIPGQLSAELVAWGIGHHGIIREKSGIIRTCLAEWEQRPLLAPKACAGGLIAFADAVRYLALARDMGLIGASGSTEAAAVMLINTIFMDAMTRDVMPGSHPHTPEVAVRSFVDLVLRGLGAKEFA